MRRHLTLTAAGLLLAGCVTTGTFEKKEAEAAGYKADLAAATARGVELRKQVEALEGELRGARADGAALQERLKASEAGLVGKQGELKAQREENARLQALVDELSRSKKKLEAAKAELEKRSAEYEQLARSLQGEIESGRVELTELKGKLTVKMKDKILFSSGSAVVGRDGIAALAKVAEALRDVQGKVIRVEGHTDDVPTTGGPWPSNWELSTARALAVVRVLQDKGVDPTRLAAAGYGEYQPVAGNDTPEGKSRNRRIEIVLAAAQ